MDNVTHALAGLLLGESIATLAGRRAGRPLAPGFRAAALTIGVVAAELPDADLLYSGAVLGMGKLGYLLHHRGHTHTVVFAVLAALALWGIALALRPALRASPERGWLLATALLGTTVTHIALDGTNSYGVHPWWPFWNGWQYGDAVFIIEPWLWIATIPFLLFLERSRVVRFLLGALLGIILVAAWRVGMVGRGVAVALTVAAPLALLLAWRLRAPHRRVAVALAAFVLVEGMFGIVARTAESRLRAATGATMLDASMNPAVGNPFCVNALVVERDGATYRATTAVIATVPAVRDAAGCPAPSPLAEPGSAAATRASTAEVRWGEQWSAPVAELQGLVRDHCDLAAAMEFIRVPIWRTLPDGRIRLADLRYERGGGGGFADIVVPPRPAKCPPGWVPGWIPPRAELLAAVD